MNKYSESYEVEFNGKSSPRKVTFTDSRLTSSKKNLFVLTLSILFVITANILVSDFFVDDGFIAFQYARNFTDSGSLYYNEGETGPYGYTNIGYIILLSIIRILTFKILSFEIISRLICSFILCYFTFIIFRLSASFKGSYSYFVTLPVSFLLLLMFPYMLPNFFSGLETASFIFVLFFLIRTTLFPQSANPLLYTICLTSGLILRFDSIICLFPLIVIEFVRCFKGSSKLKLHNIVIALLVALFIMLANYFYTGYLISLSFQHKLNHSFEFDTFMSYTRLFLLINAPLVLAYVILNKKTKLIKELPAAGFLFLYYAFISFFYSFFLNWMFYRYVFPFIFTIFILLLLKYYLKERTGIVRTSMLYFYFFILFSLIMPESFQYVSGYRISGMPAMEQLVNAMKESKLDKKFRSVASYDAGYIPYKSGWKFIDFFGLTTSEVRNNRIGTVIETNNPTILINSVTNFNLDRTIVSNYQNGADSIPSNYVLIKFLPLTNDYYWKGSNYSYFIYANENADNDLIERIKNSSVSVNETIGYQKYILDALETMYSFITKVF